MFERQVLPREFQTDHDGIVGNIGNNLLLEWFDQIKRYLRVCHHSSTNLLDRLPRLFDIDRTV
jgi:hypothetical protein